MTSVAWRWRSCTYCFNSWIAPGNIFFAQIRLQHWLHGRIIFDFFVDCKSSNLLPDLSFIDFRKNIKRVGRWKDAADARIEIFSHLICKNNITARSREIRVTFEKRCKDILGNEKAQWGRNFQFSFGHRETAISEFLSTKFSLCSSTTAVRFSHQKRDSKELRKRGPETKFAI